MTDQDIRPQVEVLARIIGLQAQQAVRIVLAEKMKKDLDAVIEVRQREIDNLKSQLIQVVR